MAAGVGRVRGGECEDACDSGARGRGFRAIVCRGADDGDLMPIELGCGGDEPGCEAAAPYDGCVVKQTGGCKLEWGQSRGRRGKAAVR